MTEDANAAPRACLFPRGMQSVQLYHSPAVLDAALQRCIAMGWELIDLNATDWESKDRLHTDLALGFNFPSYYGKNLDALHDAMAGLAEGRYGFSPNAPGGAMVFRHFDAFRATDRAAAEALLDIMATAACRALRFGWPLAVLLQSDDPDLVLTGPPPPAVEWNQTERQRADRA